ncbi:MULTISPECIES: transporter substrate-binding domain-containing protein [Paracoccus]|uniref:transporter substrate-binding domain-containing protein n=1 Tax=Paracoccus TaxID=265 RepID=UPI001FB789A2|nr:MULTISPECIES: transporter substrate-binding domain-containing protein [Paracoccus]MCJ1899262.1 transporter substrate-binding domain-containing protein [Paracoccus versutus]MDF3904246.1 transporter substrate-binding domain-containing protein [Paracoccus sp. AS002]
MKLNRRIFTALAAGALAMGLALPASAADLDAIKNAGAVRVGMLVDFPPFGIQDASGKPDGYDADVAKALGEFLGVQAQIVPVTGPNRIPYLLSGQVDVLVASLGITAERAEKVDFSKPYAGISIAVYGDSGLEVADAAGLAGQSLAVARASTQDTGVTAVAPQGTDIRRFDDDASAVQALMSGQVRLIGLSNVVFSQVAGVAGDRFDKKFDLSSQVQGIAVAPGSDALLEQINAFVDQAKTDGTLDQIHQKWLGEPLPDFVRNAQ